MKLQGRIALVTGGARGIGMGCAFELARLGADIAVNDRVQNSETDATIRAIEALGRRAILLEGDAFSEDGCESIVDRTLETFGRIDILISNPAFSRRGAFLEYSSELFNKTLQGTLAGGFYMSQRVARHMVSRGGRGKIVFISSVHSIIPYANAFAYNAAKSGLKHMARTIAAELLPHRINVNVIDPGWIDTPGEHATFGSEALAAAGPTAPWGRLGTPEDIGKAAAFLSSDDADYITGTNLVVDGGWCLKAALPSPVD
jgi:glucose 1-dehydrogenase